jgi:hypothetical protein
MELDTPFICFSIKNNIVVCRYKKNLHINLVMAREIVQARIAFTGGKKMPALIISQGVTSVDKSAREYLASDEGIEGLVASAIVVNTPFSNVLSNFFLKVNKTKLPVKIFSNTSRAEKWLQQFTVQNNF